MTKEDLSPLEALIFTIIGEARGEPIEGQVAVANIIKNRWMHNPTKYTSYKDVVFSPLQFSCWNDDSPEKGFLQDLMDKIDEPFSDRYLSQCAYVARGIDSAQIIDNTNGSLYYLTSQLFNGPHRPTWAKNPRNVKMIGNQTFFMV